MNLQEIGLKDVDLIKLAQHRLQRRASVNTEMNLWVP